MTSDTSTGPAAMPKLFAHRGSTLLAPENTRAAFELALHYQADVLEIDVRLSRDGQVIVTHDEDVDRTTNGSGLVIHKTLAELKKLDAGYRFFDLQGTHYRNQSLQLLTLGELFELYPETQINIDIKDASNSACEAVIAVIRSHHAHNRVNVGSFHDALMPYFRQIAPDISTAASRREVAALYFGSAVRNPPAFRTVQIPVSYWGLPLDRPSFIRKLQERGLHVMYWTINHERKMRELLQRGVDGIVTDRADLALAQFRNMHIK